MIIKTSIGELELWSTRAGDVSSDVMLGSKHRDTLDLVFTSLELAGVSEDHTRPADYFKELRSSVEQVVLPSGALGLGVQVDRASVCLWFNFEVLNYMAYGHDWYKQDEETLA